MRLLVSRQFMFKNALKTKVKSVLSMCHLLKSCGSIHLNDEIKMNPPSGLLSVLQPHRSFFF